MVWNAVELESRPTRAMPLRPENKPLCEGDGAHWFVERRVRREEHHSVLTDARLGSITGKGRKAVYETYDLSYSACSQKATRTTRVDLVTYRLPLAPRVYWHRAVAFAWHGPRGEFQDVGGVWKAFPVLPLTWAHFAAYEVDHGDRGPGYVLIDDLMICTRLRNVELNAEREEKTKERERAAKLRLEQSYCSPKKRRR